MIQPLISFRKISKAFGSNQANSEVSFDIYPNVFHGIVGENGAGKSTIMKILFGLLCADSGEIFLRGKQTAFKNPKDAISQKIGMVHQHFMLVPSLTVWENIVLGNEPNRLVLNKKNILKHLKALTTDFGFSVDLNQRVERLSLGEQQQVELLKALYRQSNILILDEPTAILTPQEVTHLFERLRNLRDKGKTIIVITHKLKEILTFTEWVTIMRQGKVVTTKPTHELTEQSLSQLMMGRERTSLARTMPQLKSQCVFEARGVSTNAKDPLNLRDVTFQVKAGEIIGLAGIEGNGQDLLVEALCQLRPFSGEIFLMESPLRSKTLYNQRQAGFGVIPPDRHKEGVILDFSNADNLILGHHKAETFQSKWFLNAERISEFAQRRLRELNVTPADPKLATSALSGGNQQKLLFARETECKLAFFLVCHPTRGVDIGASEFIHLQLLELAKKGAGILLVSSDLDELFALSHRILVMRAGTLVTNSPTSELSISTLGLAMTGAQG